MVKDTYLFAAKERDWSPRILGLESPHTMTPKRDCLMQRTRAINLTNETNKGVIMI
jgi:hypothetical protein